MGMESFAGNFEKNAENLRPNRTANFERAFQNSYNMERTQPRHLHTINEGLAGQEVNGVPFLKRKFTLNGEKVEGVFPLFRSEVDVGLPKRLYTASDDEQMRYCSRKLAERIERNPELEEKFTPRQLEQIKSGAPRISGLTWHHHETPGRMQLVDAYDHNAARHTGGRSLWGGGSESR